MMRMYGGVLGLSLGVVSIFGAFLLEGGSLKALFLIAPLIIVFGGTFAATIIGFGMEKFTSIFKLIKIAYFPRKYDLKGLINSYFSISIKARKEGLLAIEKELNTLNYAFPKKMVRYGIDGTDANMLEDIARLEMKLVQERHLANVTIFNKMGGYAPTMGILGTVMALIMTLANAGSDPDLLIKNIATAFIATLWGVLSANLIWLPIGDRLKECHLEEKHMMEISLEGTIALLSGEIPSILKARLVGMLPQKEQRELLEFQI
ncbi:MAG TPA: chemotaxis protein MotA [Ignavibacteria bacterium]|nr:chemotaxis protein MotA [Ignavibacteria bacterium]